MLLYVFALSDFINSRQGATPRGLQARAPSGRQIAVYLNPELEYFMVNNMCVKHHANHT